MRGPGGPLLVSLRPAMILACATARQFALWLDTAVQPLARGVLEADLASLRVGGGHECRRRNRQASGKLSEHANGKAIDIFGFAFEQRDLAISVAGAGDPKRQRFLDAARATACGFFTTVLGPGDAAHGDHLHLDTQDRRSSASRYCN